MTSGPDYESVNSACEKSCTDKIKLKAVSDISDAVLHGFLPKKMAKAPATARVVEY